MLQFVLPVDINNVPFVDFMLYLRQWKERRIPIELTAIKQYTVQTLHFPNLKDYDAEGHI